MDDSLRRGFARSLNVSAGIHQVTTDPAELRACERAALRSLAHYPYYELRYGASALRFGLSDSAWLATLCDGGMAKAVEQARWLGGVLSSRGMPQIMLEVHLRFLAEELSAEAAGETDRCRILKRAQAELNHMRLSRIAEADFERLANDFDSSVAKSGEGFMRAGELIVSAVADEAAGIELAVVSLAAFMTDASRFSKAWITAVRDAIDAARTEAGS